MASGFQNDPGTVQQEAGFGFLNRFWTESLTDGVTALAGGAQAGAPLMNSMFNRVATVANAGDSVQLPPAAQTPGGSLCVAIFNDTAKNLTVYANQSTTDTINGTAGSTGITMVPNSICWFMTIPGSAKWLANGLGYGNYTAGQYPLETLSTQPGITAAGTSSQANSTQITSAQCQVTTAPANSGVRLPPSQPGAQIVIVNNTANASLNVYPATGEQINSAGANAAFVQNITTTQVTIFFCFVAGNWTTK